MLQVFIIIIIIIILYFLKLIFDLKLYVIFLSLYWNAKFETVNVSLNHGNSLAHQSLTLSYRNDNNVSSKYSDRDSDYGKTLASHWFHN